MVEGSGRGRPAPATVISFLALVVAMSGTAVAVQNNSVGSKQLKKNSVRSKHIKRNQVKPSDVKNESLKSKQLKDGAAVSGADVIDDSLTGADIDEDSLELRGLQGPPGPQGEKGDQGDTGPPGPSTGPAGGDLTGSYPNPLIASGAVGAEEVANGSLGADDLDGSIPRASQALGSVPPIPPLNLHVGQVNFDGEGAVRTPSSGVPVGQILLTCDDAAGVSVALESSIGSDFFAVLDDGEGAVSWDQLSNGESIPSAGAAPAGGSGAGGAAHVEFSILTVDGTRAGSIDVFAFHDDPGNICYVLPESRMRA